MISFMQRALFLAKKGAKKVSPNPLVGAVLVKDGKIIGEGYHRAFGLPHAEIEAFKSAKKRGHTIKGATLYVTLEPCMHEEKKTPPCVPAVIESGVSKVIIAMKDPNPKVSGRGIQALKRAGIATEVGLCGAHAKELNAPYIKWITTAIPFVAMKVAMSLDGKTATRTGDSKWITSQKSRTYVHELRDTCDAILVGSHTILLDNPILKGKTCEPIRIILDSTLKTPLTANVLRDSNVIFATTDRAPQKKIRVLEKLGVRVKVFPKKISIVPLLKYLGSVGISSVFVEGGAEVFGSFIDSKQIDKVYWFIAPKIIGGSNAKPATSGMGVAFIKNAMNLTNMQTKQIGTDLFIEATPAF